MLRTVSLRTALVLGTLLAALPVRAQWVQLVDSTVPFNLYPSAFGSIGSTLFVAGSAYDQSIFFSNDNGINWQPLSNDPSTPSSNNVYQFETFGTYLFVASDGGISLSKDSGKSWSWLNFSSQCNVIKSSGTNLFAGRDDTLISISKDSGATWTSISGNLPNSEVDGVQDLAILDSTILVCDPGLGVFLSTNYGMSWIQDYAGLESWNGIEGWPYTHVATIGSIFFIASQDSGVFRSTDGRNWIKDDNGLDRLSVSALIACGNYLFEGSGGGVFLSSDKGTTWKAINQGLTNFAIKTLAVCDGFLYAGNFGAGVWRRPLSDFNLSSVASQPANNNSLTAFPNPLTHSTTLNFTSLDGYATVTIINQLGVEVARVFAGELAVGEHSFEWNIASELPNGMYECVVRTNSSSTSIPLLLER